MRFALPLAVLLTVAVGMGAAMAGGVVNTLCFDFIYGGSSNWSRSGGFGVSCALFGVATFIAIALLLFPVWERLGGRKEAEE